MSDEDRNRLHQVGNDVRAIRALLTASGGGDPAPPKRVAITRALSAGSSSARCSWPLPASSAEEAGPGYPASELAELKQRVAELTALVRQQQVPAPPPSTDEMGALASQMGEIKAQLAALLENR